MSSTPPGRCAVLGAGIVGLSAALELALRGHKVTVIADKFSPETTSDGAGAYWRPYFLLGSSDEDVAAWSGATLAVYLDMIKRGMAGTAGLNLVPGAELTAEPQPMALWARNALDFRQMTQEQRDRFGPGYRGGVAFTSVIVDTGLFMAWLTNELRRLGVALVCKKVTSVQKELVAGGAFDVVVNCCGLGSRHLFNDPDVYPVRGQVLKVRAPHVRQFLVDEDGPLSMSYIFPRLSGVVVLGGTHTDEDWRTEVDAADTERILRYCTTLMPELKGAPVLSVWAGLRPVRKAGLRLELDEAWGVPVVHNYGHGGSGWTVWKGTAVRAAELAEQALTKQRQAAPRARL